MEHRQTGHYRHNHSNVAIDAGLSFTATASGVTGTFYTKSGANYTAITADADRKISLESAAGKTRNDGQDDDESPKGTLYFGVSGGAIDEDKSLGTITVKIAKGTGTESGSSTENDPKITSVALSGDMVTVDADSKTYTITVPSSGTVSPTFTVSGTNLDVLFSSGYSSPCGIGFFSADNDSEPWTALQVNLGWTQNNDGTVLSISDALVINTHFVGTYNLKYSNDSKTTWTDTGWTVVIVEDTTSGGSTENEPKITGVALSGDAVKVDEAAKTYTVTIPSGENSVELTITISGENLDRIYDTDYSTGTKYRIDVGNNQSAVTKSYSKNDDGTISYDKNSVYENNIGTHDLKYSNDDGSTWIDTGWDVVVVRGSSEGTTTDEWTTVTDETALKNALAAGGKIKLGANITLTNMIETEASDDLDITLDLNGFSITEAGSFSADNNMLTFTNAEKVLKLTILDSSDEQTGKIEGTSAGAAVYFMCATDSDGSSEITLESGTISGIKALSLGGKAKANIDGGTLIGNAKGSSDGAALDLNGRDASAVVTGGTVRDTSGMSAIKVTNSNNKLEIKGGEIEGSIEVASNITITPTITITGGTFSFDPTQYIDTDNYKVTKNPPINPLSYTVEAKN